jgi:hypothetical protein
MYLNYFLKRIIYNSKKLMIKILNENLSFLNIKTKKKWLIHLSKYGMKVDIKLIINKVSHGYKLPSNYY